MAYFCLTLIEANAGDQEQAKERKKNRKREKAGKKYRISCEVLAKLGELTSTRGDEKTARKSHRLHTPLSGAETRWIEAAVKAIIRRVAEIDSDPILPEITMSDLPAL
jgi:hypothetical protein